MIDDLTPYQIQTYLKRIQEYGEVGLKGIEIFQAGQLLEFINNEMDEIVSWTNKMILSNPNYEYPPEFPEGKRAKYWAESRDFDNKRKIRNIIKKFLLNHSLKKEATEVIGQRADQTQTKDDDTPNKLTSKYHYLALMLDHEAIKDPLWEKEKIKKIAANRTGNVKGLKGETIARHLYNYPPGNFEKEPYLIDNFGEGWRNKVLEVGS